MAEYTIKFEVTICGSHTIEAASDRDAQAAWDNFDWGDDFPVTWGARCELKDWDATSIEKEDD